MNFSLYKSNHVNDIKELFTSVFTDSEGQDEGEVIGKLAFELQETTHPNDIFGFIAKDNKNIIGCIFFTRLIFKNNVNTFILSPVAISTQHQNQGIGQKLIKFGIGHLKNNNVELIFTYGDPDFYSKVGFQQITENIAQAPLKLTYPSWMAGTITCQ